MQTVRTTISLPKALHSQLRMQAVSKQVSLGQLVTEKLLGAGTVDSSKELAAKKERHLKLFSDVAAVGVDIDLTGALREDRDR